jgi:hypothetical protein
MCVRVRVCFMCVCVFVCVCLCVFDGSRWQGVREVFVASLVSLSCLFNYVRSICYYF